MSHGIGLASFIGEVPEYEVRDGRMHVTLGDFRLVMPLPVFEEGARRAAEAIAVWRYAQMDKVKPIRR